MDANELESLRHEYTEVNNNHRHYSGLRFAVFSVYFAVLGGLVSVAFGFVEVKSSDGIDIILISRVAGLLFTLVFFSFEILCELNLRHFKKVARELEGMLGYRQFKTRKFPLMPRASWFTWSMYIILIVFWIILIARRA